MELHPEQVEALRSYMEPIKNADVYHGMLDPLNVILLHAGCRPGIELSATIPPGTLSTRTPHAAIRADPHEPLLEAFDFTTETNVHVPAEEDDEEITVTHMLARDPDRISNLLNNTGASRMRSAGEFLAYPPQAVDRFERGGDANDWISFLENRTLTRDEVRALALISYVPTPTDAGFERAIARGTRYDDVLTEILSTHELPHVAARLETAREATARTFDAER